MKIKINKYDKNHRTSWKPYFFIRGGHKELWYLGWIRLVVTIDWMMKNNY